MLKSTMKQFNFLFNGFLFIELSYLLSFQNSGAALLEIQSLLIREYLVNRINRILLSLIKRDCAREAARTTSTTDQAQG